MGIGGHFPALFPKYRIPDNFPPTFVNLTPSAELLHDPDPHADDLMQSFAGGDEVHPVDRVLFVFQQTVSKAG